MTQINHHHCHQQQQLSNGSCFSSCPLESRTNINYVLLYGEPSSVSYLTQRKCHTTHCDLQGVTGQSSSHSGLCIFCSLRLECSSTIFPWESCSQFSSLSTNISLISESSYLNTLPEAEHTHRSPHQLRIAHGCLYHVYHRLIAVYYLLFSPSSTYKVSVSRWQLQHLKLCLKCNRLSLYN